MAKYNNQRLQDIKQPLSPAIEQKKSDHPDFYKIDIPPPQWKQPGQYQYQQYQYQQQKQQSSNKCFVYCLLFFVILSAALLTFACVVLKVRTPKFQLHSTKITSLNYDLSPSISLNLETRLMIENHNFGELMFDKKTTALRLFYQDLSIGEVKLDKSLKKLGFQSKEELKFITLKGNVGTTTSSNTTTNGSSSSGGGLKDDLRLQDMLRNQLSSGFLDLVVFGDWKGKVDFFGKFNRSASGQVNCSLTIDSKQQDVQSVFC